VTDGPKEKEKGITKRKKRKKDKSTRHQRNKNTCIDATYRPVYVCCAVYLLDDNFMS
jgi:hypothetical protein